MKHRNREETGTITESMQGEIELQDVSMFYGQAPVLKDISFTVAAGSKVAVIGPTAAGKTQLLYLLTALMKPTSGSIKFDGQPIEKYNSESFPQAGRICFPGQHHFQHEHP